MRNIKSLNFLSSICLILALTGGCVHVNTVSLTSIPADRNKVVNAESSRFLLFGISFSSDFIDEAIKELSVQCDGKIEGVLTKFETHNYFLFIFMTEHVIARGFCR